MFFRKNYFTGNLLKETVQYSQCSSHPVPIQRHINSPPWVLCIPAGWFVPCGRPVFPFSEDLHPPRLQPAHLLLWLLTRYYFHREMNKHRLEGTAKTVNGSESAADPGVQSEDSGDSSRTNGHGTQGLHAACCRGGGRHGEKHAESGFAIRTSTKASAAVAFECEGCKGCAHSQQAPASAADSPNNALQELFPFTTVVFFTRVGTPTRKRSSVLSNNNTMLYNTQ